jgi:hypothetical protein
MDSETRDGRSPDAKDPHKGLFENPRWEHPDAKDPHKGVSTFEHWSDPVRSA